MVGLATLAFFPSMRFLKAVPPVLLALVVGLAAAFLTGNFGGGYAPIVFVAPEFTAPVFTPRRLSYHRRAARSTTW